MADSEPAGKRWTRRRENARFAHNPHVALPTSVDFARPLQLPSSTFPHPLPSYLPRSVPLPPARTPPSLPRPSAAGLFSLSLRGVRRTLRARPSAPYLVKAIETHLAEWLQGGTYLNPDQSKDALCFPGGTVGGREDIREVAREAGRLVWAVGADATLAGGGFERYVVHCVARWHGVVSFSKETDGHRLTYLLRPNIIRPDPRAIAASPVLDTPPATDASDASPSDFNTTDASDPSDVDSVTGDPLHSLSDIEESRPASPASWSVVGGSDFAIDPDSDADERGFAASMESLSLPAHPESDNFVTSAADTTLTQDSNSVPSRARTERGRFHTVYPRPTSSPSPARRSPHRLPHARELRKRKAKKAKKDFAGAAGSGQGTFYDYLFV